MDYSYRTVIVFNDGTSITSRFSSSEAARFYIAEKLRRFPNRVGVIYHHGTLIDICHFKPRFYSEEESS